MYVRFFVTEQDILHFRRRVAEGQVIAPDAKQTEIEITLSDGSTFPTQGASIFSMCK